MVALGLGRVPLDCHDDRDVPWLVNLLYPPLFFPHSCSCVCSIGEEGYFPKTKLNRPK